jgi:hypothetical protein
LIATLALTCDPDQFCSDAEVSVVEEASGNGICDVVSWDRVEVELKENA